MKLDSIVPWGRSYDEYVAMFSLSEEDVRKSILDVGGGPSSFNAELTKRGGAVVSFDPAYSFSLDQIRSRIDLTYRTVVEQVRLNQGNYRWQSIRSVDELGETRMSAMRDFLADFESGKDHGRYLPLELPNILPFGCLQFDLAVMSHLLFLYSQHLSYSFHLASIIEVMRVAKEMRIFPLLTLDGKPSSFLGDLMKDLDNAGFSTEIHDVGYEFQIGGNQMLVVCR